MIKWRNLDPTLKSKFNGVPRRQYHVFMHPSSGVSGSNTADNEEFIRQHVEDEFIYYDPYYAADAAPAFSDIIVWPGYYNMATAIPLNKDGMRLLAACMGPGHALSYATRMWSDGCAAVEIQGAKGCEVAGFRFGPESTDATAINVGTTVNSYGAYIHDNTFFHENVENGCTYIDLGVASTYHSDESVIANNLFIKGAGNATSYAQIRWNLSIRSHIIGNTFEITGGSTNYQGIKVTAGVEQDHIIGNKFFAFESGTVQAIAVGATTVGHLYIDGNEFIGMTANANCFDYDADSSGRNYLNGVLIDS